MTRQFRKRFRVRRRGLEIWLEFLANNHPGYREFTLNRTTLNQLPEDGDVLEQLSIHTVEDLDGIPADAGPVDENLASTGKDQDLDEACLIWYFKTQSLPNCRGDVTMKPAISLSSLPYIAIALERLTNCQCPLSAIPP
jgi:hypothetical protein